MSIGDLFYYRYNIPGRRSKPDPPFLPSLFSSSSFFLFWELCLRAYTYMYKYMYMFMCICVHVR